MKIFNINRGSTVPYLEMEPIVDGRNDFGKLYIAIQSATVTFSMTNVDTGVKKIANAPAYVVPFNDGGCEDRFKIQYRWKERDVKEPGRYKAEFKIKFDGDIKADGYDDFPTGILVVPIREELIVDIN